MVEHPTARSTVRFVLYALDVEKTVSRSAANQTTEGADRLKRNLNFEYGNEQ